MIRLTSYTVEDIGKDASEEPIAAPHHYTVLFRFDDGSEHRAVLNWPDVVSEDHLHELVLAYAEAYQAGLAVTAPPVQAGHRRSVDPDDHARRERERSAPAILPNESEPEPEA